MSGLEAQVDDQVSARQCGDGRSELRTNHLARPPTILYCVVVSYDACYPIQVILSKHRHCFAARGDQGTTYCN
jgi:hypothetical protein